jgi:prepilin-type N-terminal cleavage/methylation domain-containing protein
LRLSVALLPEVHDVIQAFVNSRKHRGDRGFTLIELLVVISILGILSAVVVFSVRGVTDKGQDTAISTDAQIIRTAEEAYCAKNGQYGTVAQLQSGSFLASGTTYSKVFLNSNGSCKGAGAAGAGATGFTIASTATGTVNIAANADQWITSDSGSGPGYSSSAFVYPLNSNLNEPLIIMNSDYTLSGGLAASWSFIPRGSSRATADGMTPGAGSTLPSSPTPYVSCSGVADRPFCADTLRLHLRQGVTFQDGQPFNADDVIWTWRDRQPFSGSTADGENTLGFTMAFSGAASGCATNLTLCGYDSVEKIDNYTVDFTPRSENLRLAEQIVHPKGAIVEVLRNSAGVPIQAPASMQTPGLSSPRNLGRHLDGSTGGIPAGAQVFGVAGSPAATPLIAGTPEGTGPFKFLSYNPTVPENGGTASFVANPNYWGSAGAQVHQMNYFFVPDPAARTAGLESGQFDMDIDINALDTAAVKAAPFNDRVVSAPYGQNSLIYVNKVIKMSPATLDFTKVGPATPPNYTFNIGTDPAVRRAVSLGIDRAAVVTAIYGGNAAPGQWMSPPGILGPSASLVPPLTTDLVAAANALDADGWTCGGAAPGGMTACNTGSGEIRAWHGDARFTTGRQLTLYMVGISVVPQTGYDLLKAQMLAIGVNLVTERGSCDSAIICADGTVGRGQMYNTALWDLDLELPNQNDANAAFLPVLRQACPTASNFRFAPADGTNAIDPAVTDTAALGGGVFPHGNTPCSLTSDGTHTPAVLGPMDTTYVPNSNGATTQAANQVAAGNMMAILVNQNQTNIVIPVVGQYRIYGMTSKVNLGDPHPSQTSQRWVSLTKSP